MSRLPHSLLPRIPAVARGVRSLSSSSRPRRRAGLAGLALAVISPGVVVPMARVHACDAKFAEHVRDFAIDEAGEVPLADGGAGRLLGIAWPDAFEPERRAAVRAHLLAALTGEQVFLHRAVQPDRWGRAGLHVFVRETGRPAAAPFWLQAGLVEAGLVTAWPEPALGACWERLAAHEATARTAGAGLWAEAQGGAGDTQNFVTPQGAPTYGRKSTMIARVNRARKGRLVWFLDLDSPQAPGRTTRWTVMVGVRAVQSYERRGMTMKAWEGVSVIVRGVWREARGAFLRVDRPEQLAPIATPAARRP